MKASLSVTKFVFQNLCREGQPLAVLWGTGHWKGKSVKKLSLVLMEIDLCPHYLGERNSWFRIG